MTTMLNADSDEKSLQSFRIPLEIVREDPEHKHYHQSTVTDLCRRFIINCYL